MTWRAGQSFRREAVVHLTQGMRGYQAIVDIKAKTVLSWTEVPGRQYMTSREEVDQANALAMKGPRVRSALTKRGITDFTHVGCGPANHGYFDLPEERGHRVVHLACGDDRHRVSGYGSSIEGLVIVADLTDKKILRVVDTGVQPTVEPNGDHDVEAVGPTRETRNPVSMVQPNGPSFTLDGHHRLAASPVRSAPASSARETASTSIPLSSPTRASPVSARARRASSSARRATSRGVTPATVGSTTNHASSAIWCSGCT